MDTCKIPECRYLINVQVSFEDKIFVLPYSHRHFRNAVAAATYYSPVHRPPDHLSGDMDESEPEAPRVEDLSDDAPRPLTSLEWGRRG